VLKENSLVVLGTPRYFTGDPIKNQQLLNCGSCDKQKFCWGCTPSLPDVFGANTKNYRFYKFTVCRCVVTQANFNSLASGCFRGFSEKTPKRTWLCAGISPLLFGLRTWSKRQKTRQVFESAPWAPTM